MAREDPARAASLLFDFYVLDPACGSGHFLVEVVDELADKIATLLGEVALPDVRAQLEALRSSAGATWGAGIEDTALLKRLVLKRCVYGVDLSPMGAEIAKVSLWLHAFVPGLSLAYLDHNIQCGNSLIGVADREEVGQDTLFGDAIARATADASRTATALRAIDDTTPELVKASRSANRDLRATVADVQRFFSLWTAEPLGLAGARNEALVNGARLIAGGTSALVSEGARLAKQFRVLHWPLAFPDVFARVRPEFDAVVGNPPWEEITVEEQSFFARYRPGIRRGMPEAEREAAVGTLVSGRPDLLQQLADEKQRVSRMRAFFRSEYASSLGDPDLYKLFCQRYGELLRSGGTLGVVLPRNAFATRGSAGFRSWLLDHAPPVRIDFLRNRRRWAFDVHPQQSVALLIARRSSAATDSSFRVAGVAESTSEFAEQTRNDGLLLKRTALGRYLEVPLLPTQAHADLLAKLRDGSPFALGGGAWQCFPVAEFHETNDRSLWRGATDGRPLWKGESFGQFDPHGAGQRWCPPSEAALDRARKPRPGSESVLATSIALPRRRDAVLRSLDRPRVAFTDVTQRTNSRTVVACLIPPEHFLTNKAPYLAFVDEDPQAEAACLALLNSLPFDWQARRFVEINLNFFILEGLRLPELTHELVAALAEPGARLSCYDERFAAFAAANGVEVGPLAPEERDSLRADIDALVAHAYGLTDEELEVVFSDFTLDAVAPAYRNLVRERYAAL